MNQNTIITNDNDIYIYFKLIEQLQPASILDVGLFLQRIGAVSRQAMSCEIPPQVYSEGLDLFGENIFPVYHKIYDKITRLPDFSFTDHHIYDMAVYMHVNEWLHPDDRLVFWQYLITHARVIISDTADTEFVNFVVTNCTAEAINVDGEQYAIIYGNVPQPEE